VLQWPPLIHPSSGDDSFGAVVEFGRAGQIRGQRWPGVFHGPAVGETRRNTGGVERGQQHVGGGRPAAPARRSIRNTSRLVIARILRRGVPPRACATRTPMRSENSWHSGGTPPTFDPVLFSHEKGKMDLIFRDACFAWPAGIEATHQLQMHPGTAVLVIAAISASHNA
jgi:hypothetical protein